MLSMWFVIMHTRVTLLMEIVVWLLNWSSDLIFTFSSSQNVLGLAPPPPLAPFLDHTEAHLKTRFPPELAGALLAMHLLPGILNTLSQKIWLWNAKGIWGLFFLATLSFRVNIRSMLHAPSNSSCWLMLLQKLSRRPQPPQNMVLQHYDKGVAYRCCSEGTREPGAFIVCTTNTSNLVSLWTS